MPGGWWIGWVAGEGYPIVTAVWSLSAMGHALVTSVFGFGVARFFLGLGESGNFPAAIKATAEWFPPKERALATGIFNSGAGVGAILAPFIVPWVALHFGWRAAFLVTGVFSAIWIVWWSIRYRSPQNLPDLNRGEAVAAAAAPAIPWWRLLKYRQAWAFILGKFLTDPVWWFYLFWLPGYFSKEFKLDLSHIGLPLDRGVCLLDDWQRIWWLAAEGICTPGNALKAARLAAMLTCACLVVPIAFAGGLQSDMDCRCAAVYGNQRAPGLVGQHLHDSVRYVSAEYVGTVVSFGQVGGALGGAIFAQVAGHVLQFTGSYALLFMYSGSAYLVALVLLRTLAPGLKPAELASS